MYIIKDIFFQINFQFHVINLFCKGKILCLILDGISAKSHAPTIYTIEWRGERDLNPRVIADMGLAIPRPTKL
ncbi:MAG: hypothetical protein ACREAK_10490, partial [Nitrosarchaeum sp.]